MAASVTCAAIAANAVERLQRMIWEGEEPKKVIETPVYEFAA
jgi:hypothetical protein